MYKIKAFFRKALLSVLAFGCRVLDAYRSVRKIVLLLALTMFATSYACVTVQKSGEYRVATKLPSVVVVQGGAMRGTAFRFNHNGKTYFGSAQHVCSAIMQLTGGRTVTLIVNGKEQTETVLGSAMNEDGCVISDSIGGPSSDLNTGFQTGSDVYTIGFPGGLKFYYGTGQVLADLREDSIAYLSDDIDMLYCNMIGSVVQFLPPYGLKYCTLPQTFITSNILVDHGQSGSPLFNSRGEVIGIGSQQRVNGSLWASSRVLIQIIEGLPK